MRLPAIVALLRRGQHPIHTKRSAIDLATIGPRHSVACHRVPAAVDDGAARRPNSTRPRQPARQRAGLVHRLRRATGGYPGQRYDVRGALAGTVACVVWRACLPPLVIRRGSPYRLLPIGIRTRLPEVRGAACPVSIDLDDGTHNVVEGKADTLTRPVE